jgi:hypothetical protein
MDQYVDALAFDMFGNLYVGGNFFHAGGVLVNGIAEWNGTAWSGFGSGMNHIVSSLAFDSSGNLDVGGYFTLAGNKDIAYLAKLLLSQSSYNLSLKSLVAGTNIVNVITGLGTPNNTYALDLATNLAPPVNWVPQATNTPTGVNLVFTNVSDLPQGYYRTRSVP